MRRRVRWFGLGLILAILVMISISLVVAREFHINPKDLQPGIREEGSWIYCVRDRCGKLLPILPYYPGKVDPPKDPGNQTGTQAASSTPGSTAIRVGQGGAPTLPVPVHLPSPVHLSRAGGLKNIDAGAPVGSFLQGGSASSHIDQLEDSLRDTIHRLNEK